MDQTILVVAAAIFKDGCFLIARRGPGQVGAGLWEFPGGKVDPGETEEEALGREIREELGIQIFGLRFLAENIHQYPSKKILLRLYYAEPETIELKLIDHDEVKWTLPQQMEQQGFSEADQPFVQMIRQQQW